jgi:dienelactone hydrolase
VHDDIDRRTFLARVARFAVGTMTAAGILVALAPDALFPLGGYPGDEEQARALLPRLEQPKAFEDFIAATHFLRAQPGTNGRLGVVGFCYGGAIANRLAAALPDLAAAVPFYGSAPPLEQVPAIEAELLRTDSTTTPPRATTRRRRSSRGGGRWSCSTGHCACKRDQRPDPGNQPGRLQ